MTGQRFPVLAFWGLMTRTADNIQAFNQRVSLGDANTVGARVCDGRSHKTRRQPLTSAKRAQEMKQLIQQLDLSSPEGVNKLNVRVWDWEGRCNGHADRELRDDPEGIPRGLSPRQGAQASRSATPQGCKCKASPAENKPARRQHRPSPSKPVVTRSLQSVRSRPVPSCEE
ncbi:uncharacterized protein BJ171DRAFT_33305 [Polychytrium aggregatum]|uniref:uncharacterized protein n=1 Tax=Polychytrium aggregatum TaxID=110093 RepID=UPI0022FE288E|nr:uncharacterized protein BJ171DRAFT_33305 [Polychytrium aggregatum]KAI9192941.1 hypothetical protein BJ171DRAFT_33305 [Polychytrium aggregatum]